jgi:hypothetical protein
MAIDNPTALVGVSRARATLAPLDQANASTRFDDDRVRELISRAVNHLNESLAQIRRRSHYAY